MEVSNSEENRAPSSQHQMSTLKAKRAAKYRVRTGCLVCRARKVKCDEQRPSCRKCIRLNKPCSYSIPNGWASPGLSLSTADSECSPEYLPYRQEPPGDVQRQSEIAVYSSPGQTDSLGLVPNLSRTETADYSMHRVPTEPAAGTSSDSFGSLFSPYDVRPGGAPLLHDDAESPADRFHATSQIIYLTTIMDWKAVSEGPELASFSYFTEVVDCPLLSPFDQLNWTRIKQHIAGLGLQHVAVAESLLAVQALYRTQVDHLAISNATAIYRDALRNFTSFSSDSSVEFDVVLVIVFLLCLGAVTLPNDDNPPLEALSGALIVRLQNWAVEKNYSPVSLRICAWLQLLNTTTKRPGSPGLLSQSVLDFLYNHVKEVPVLSGLDGESHPEHCLYDTIATPIFNFYLRVQKISNEVADVTHYRRSRTTLADQAEVTETLKALRTGLSNLWDSRPAPLQLEPARIRQHFSVPIADPIIELGGISIAAFHAEIISIGRILGDPPFPSEDAKQAMNQIRSTVEGDWNVCTDNALSPGYMRSLFVYGLESFQKDESEWAATQLRRIRHRISSNNFLASFLEAHSDAQRAQRRRVTMKYFCYRTFRVPLPFM